MLILGHGEPSGVSAGCGPGSSVHGQPFLPGRAVGKSFKLGLRILFLVMGEPRRMADGLLAKPSSLVDQVMKTVPQPPKISLRKPKVVRC